MANTWQTTPGAGERVDRYQICVTQPNRRLRVWTSNSVYDIEVIDPAVRGAMVCGGAHFGEPRPATLAGARPSATELWGGRIAVGMRLEIHADGQAILTSPVWCIEIH